MKYYELNDDVKNIIRLSTCFHEVLKYWDIYYDAKYFTNYGHNDSNRIKKERIISFLGEEELSVLCFITAVNFLKFYSKKTKELSNIFKEKNISMRKDTDYLDFSSLNELLNKIFIVYINDLYYYPEERYENMLNLLSLIKDYDKCNESKFRKIDRCDCNNYCEYFWLCKNHIKPEELTKSYDIDFEELKKLKFCPQEK